MLVVLGRRVGGGRHKGPATQALAAPERRSEQHFVDFPVLQRIDYQMVDVFVPKNMEGGSPRL